MKEVMRPGNMLAPIPAALISCADKSGNTNLITIAWTGTICSDPVMLYISVRPERYSHHMIMESGEFVLNITTEEMTRAVDLCGVRSGRDVNKWELTGLTPRKASAVSAPLVKESPVNIECKVTEVKHLGSHDMFIAEAVAVDADKRYFDENGKLDLTKTGMIAYVHGSYMSLGEPVGSFGYSVRKKCDVRKICGGCSYSGVSYNEQLKKKQKRMESLLDGLCDVQAVIGMKNPMYYRNKVHHVFGYRKGEIISGSYTEGTHRIVNTDDCLLEDRECQNIMKTIRSLCRSFKIRIYNEDTGKGLLRHVLIRKGYKSGEIMVVLVLASQILPGKNNFVKALKETHPEITTIVMNVNDKQTSMVLGDFEKPIFGPGFIKDELCGRTFRISPKSFYQVNPVQTEVLYKTAIEFAALTGKEAVLDAYCGIGTIGICAAKNARRVIGVELNADAVRDARINAKENSCENIEFHKADATKWIGGCSEKIDVIFMDPPRTGSTPEFISSVSRLSPERVVYVSCGPDTLTRDIKEFMKHGYKAVRIQPVDMFPFTDHIENIVLLRREAI